MAKGSKRSDPIRARRTLQDMTTALALPLQAPPHSRPRLRLLHYEPEPGPAGTDPPLRVSAETAPLEPVPPGPVPPGPDDPAAAAEIAEAHRGVVRVLRLAMEVLDGRRPPAQLAVHVEPPVLRYWRAAAQQRLVRSPARFARIRLCLPRCGVAEVAVTCDIDGRARALAARFERDPRGWRCTALRLG